MSIEPPGTERAISGPVIVLGFVSVLLLVLVLIFGMLAFGIGIPGVDDDPEPTEPAEALVSSGFTIVNSTIQGNTATIDIDLVVLNTGDDQVEDMQVIVQCEDGGYASAIANVPVLEPNAGTTIRLQLSGTGEPACREPNIAFSPQREAN